MSNVFICYRRDDSAHQAGRIYDRLVAKFGRHRVFKDVDSIPLGLDFRTVLSDRVGGCDVVLVIIGDQWLTASATGTTSTRLSDPTDFVRVEVESALARRIPVIPVLVGRGGIPTADELPESLKALAFRNGIPVRADPDFHRDMTRLIEGIEEAAAIKTDRPKRLPVAKPVTKVETRSNPILMVGIVLFAILGLSVAIFIVWLILKDGKITATLPSPTTQSTGPTALPEAAGKEISLIVPPLKPGEYYEVLTYQLKAVEIDKMVDGKVTKVIEYRPGEVKDTFKSGRFRLFRIDEGSNFSFILVVETENGASRLLSMRRPEISAVKSQPPDPIEPPKVMPKVKLD